MKTPTFFTAPGTKTYRAFVALYEANDASIPYQQVLHFRGQDLCNQSDEATFDPAEFAAEEDLNLKKDRQQSTGQQHDAEQEQLKQQDLQHFDVDAQCPFHPQGHHTWGECTLYSKAFGPSRSSAEIGSLTLSPQPSNRGDSLLEASSLSAELARWHFRLGHLPYDKLRELAKRGEIPKKLKDAIPPKCAGCLFGAMTKVPWRTKGQNQSNVFVATYPGQCTSVDQFQSSQAGFVAQLKGKLTTRRYYYGTVFVDHFSRLHYMHFMTVQTSAKTLQAKQAYEKFASERG
ncbi:hypothetical protein ACHAW6_003196, partial [Cyclotella cf. meneghiniana]